MDGWFMAHLAAVGTLGPEIALRIVTTELEYRRTQRQDEVSPQVLPRPDQAIPEMDPDWAAFIDDTIHERGWANTSLYIGWLEVTQQKLIAMLDGERPLPQRNDDQPGRAPALAASVQPPPVQPPPVPPLHTSTTR